MKTSLSSILFVFLLTIRAYGSEASAPVSCNLLPESAEGIASRFSIDPKYTLKFEAEGEEAKAKFYQVGKVLRGKCKGGTLYVVAIEWSVACGKSSGSPEYIFADQITYAPTETIERVSDCKATLRAIDFEGKFITSAFGVSSLSKMKTTKGDSIKLISDPLTKWDELFLPNEKVKLGAHRVQLGRTKYGLQAFVESIDNLKQYRALKLLATIPGIGKVYQDGRAGFLEEVDHVVTELDLARVKPPEDYVFMTFWPQFAKKMELSEKDLITQNGGEYFIPKTNLKIYKDAFEVVTERYEWASQLYPEHAGKKMTFKEFLDLDPYIVMKDPLGQRQVFKRVMLTLPQMAEPLVYLYSDKKLAVEIKFGPQIQLTRVKPPYNGSWKVIVTPPNQIVDVSTGRTMKTLFWEGKAYLTPPWTSGWVIARQDLESFFSRQLISEGLNLTEAKHFMQYWLPRMQLYPFYKIRFFNREFLNIYAPISIVPEPDSLIRVHMEFQGLNAPVAMAVPKATVVPLRSGFSFVEWSGFDYSYQD